MKWHEEDTESYNFFISLFLMIICFFMFQSFQSKLYSTNKCKFQFIIVTYQRTNNGYSWLRLQL